MEAEEEGKRVVEDRKSRKSEVCGFAAERVGNVARTLFPSQQEAPQYQIIQLCMRARARFFTSSVFFFFFFFFP